MAMFGIGLPELIVILIVALLVVGPSKLPDLARSLGKALNEFRKMADDVKTNLNEEISLEEPGGEDKNKLGTQEEKAAGNSNKDKTGT